MRSKAYALKGLKPKTHSDLRGGCLLLFGGLLILLALLLPSSTDLLHAQQTQAVSNDKSINLNKNIVLLMDSSGSMKRTDPKSYRIPAAKLFVSLVGEDVRIAVLSFGDVVKTLIPLTENKRSSRTKIQSAIDKVTSKEFSTHIHLAVKKGLEILSETKEKTGILILMSDGKLTLGSDEKDEEAKKELFELLGDAKKMGVKIYTIPFTEESDIALLERIAKETGAFSRLARSDSDIHKIFASIFEKISSPDTVPIRDDGFTIDQDVKEAILLITKQPKTKTTLVNPKGSRITYDKKPKEILWHSEEVFDMITIPEPMPGNWKVNLSTKEGNRVYVLTNLRLKTSFDRNTVFKGERLKIDAWLEKEGGVVTEQEVLTKVTFILDAIDPHKKTSQTKMVLDAVESAVVPSRGRYLAEFLVEQVGDYTLSIIAEGNTFKRQKVLEFKAEEKPVTENKEAEQKTSQPKAAQKKQANQWTQALLIFGVVNGVLLVLIATTLLTRKFLQKRSKKR